MVTRLAPRPILPVPRPHPQPIILPPYLASHCVLDLQPIQSTKWLDHSGYGNHATNHGATPTAKGRYGFAWGFDGEDDYFSCVDHNSLNSLTTSFSISMWVKQNKTGSYFLIQKGSANNHAYVWYGTMPDMVFLVGDGTTFDTMEAKNLFPDSDWLNVVTTFDNGLATIYQNGVAFASKAMSVSAVSLSSTIQQIGARVTGGSTGYFKGLIDQVHIFNICTPASDTNALYELGKP